MNNGFQNCFAYGETQCSVLTEMLCKTKGKCRFFKTEEQYKKDQQIYKYINEYRERERNAK